ncbi:MAG: hypothetical protein ABIT68_02305 [Sphingomicrobium sp.]
MIKSLFLGAAALALSAPAYGQSMPGMTMPMPAKPAAKAKAPAKKPAPSKKAPAAAKHRPAKAAATPAPPPREPATIDHSTMDHGAMPMPVETPPVTAPIAPLDHSQMDHGTTDQAPMPGMDQPASAGGPQPAMVGMDHGGLMAMTGVLGPYPAERESSGTAWQPDASTHTGLMSQYGDWMLMGHGVLNLVYDHQSGPRGDSKAFVSGMLMGMAQRPLGNGTLQFKAMLSPDPLMGKRGYPLLLASGETANGTDRLIDRQHPHDLFMELSGSVSQNLGSKSSVFIYAGLPGEPAFGPPAFMHREAIMDSPEAPISHHWLDSTHISFGVLTAGVVIDRVKLEVSRFNGREPDQHRWNIETGPLDSTSVRLSWNPSANLALQGSWGHFTDPEQLEPGVDQKRWSASVLYARDLSPDWKLAGTLAWGRKTIEGQSDDAFALEASAKHRAWTVFVRGELAENRELLDLEHGPSFRVGKVSIGAVRYFAIAKHLSLGLGGLVSVNFVPDGLAPLYGGHNPMGAMGFARLKLN